MIAPEEWMRQPTLPPPSEEDSKQRRIVRSALRAVVFVSGAMFTLILTVALGYVGAPVAIICGNLMLVPVAASCWVLATRGKSRDRWTAAYIVLVVLEYVLFRIVVAVIG